VRWETWVLAPLSRNSAAGAKPDGWAAISQANTREACRESARNACEYWFLKKLALRGCISRSSNRCRRKCGSPGQTKQNKSLNSCTRFRKPVPRNRRNGTTGTFWICGWAMHPAMHSDPPRHAGEASELKWKQGSEPRHCWWSEGMCDPQGGSPVCGKRGFSMFSSARHNPVAKAALAQAECQIPVSAEPVTRRGMPCRTCWAGLAFPCLCGQRVR
jgi:hypothetical protein